MGIDDALNPGIDEDLGADNTGLMRAVQRRAFGGHAIYSRLDDGILFGVDTAAKFVVLTLGTWSCSRRHPTSSQWAMPFGVPL